MGTNEASNGNGNKGKETLEDLLAYYLGRLNDGERLDPDQILKNHPELGRDILKNLEVFSGMNGSGDKVTSLGTLGDYKLLSEIGRGGMGVVYEAEQVSLNRKVALKVLPSHLSYSKEAVLKFHREAEAGGRQSHPGIVSIYAVGEQEKVHYIAQELIEGGRTLDDRLEEIRESGEQPQGYFRDVAQLFVELADALQHAHDRGVIHRDLKPSNILLTKEGIPKIADFGLAKIEDALTLSRTGDFAGTPYYMSPEQAVSKRIGIDRRTDIYSLGVTLYEILTLQRPFEGDTSQEVLKKILLIDPVNPHKVNPLVPYDLSTICLKAMEKQPERRYQSMGEFAEDLSRFLSGDVILAKPTRWGTRLWKRVKRNPVLSSGVALTVTALVVLLVVVPWIILHKERDHARSLEAERNKAVVQYEEIVRLSDVKRLTDLKTEAEKLWPANPENIPDFQSWIKRAEGLKSRLEVHRKTLAALRQDALTYDEAEVSKSQNWKFKDTEIQWQHDTLEGLISGIELLANEEEGLLKSVNERLAFATTIQKQSIEDFRELWDEAIASIADEEEYPQYKGLQMEPMIGFVPIGQDPKSGLWEFAHLQTGEIPIRDTEGELFLDEEMGLVFVLIPGGTFNMGAVRPSDNNPPGSPNVDPEADSDEGPVHEVSLKPFLLSKYEMTQGQWLRFTGNNPSSYNPSTSNPSWNRQGNSINLLHPVERVSWEDCSEVLSKLKLRLPTESEWEYACRAGTSSVFWKGDEKASLQGTANLCDAYCKTHGGQPSWVYEEGIDDGYTVHAPIGCFRPSAFGLHDVLGNVWEWCEDFYARYENTPIDGTANKSGSSDRVMRGGSWSGVAFYCRSANRGGDDAAIRSLYVGVRPASSCP